MKKKKSENKKKIVMMGPAECVNRMRQSGMSPKEAKEKCEAGGML